MYIVTGGAGFIGSVLIAELNSRGIEDILVVDNLHGGDKWRNLQPLRFADILSKESFIQKISEGTFANEQIEGVMHLGACSSTTEKRVDYLIENNYRYTVQLAEFCVSRGIRYIYASSGSTYGIGTAGFSDAPELLQKLEPIHPYGYSKHLADLAIVRRGLVQKCVGLKFFNVFGPNEYHKGFQKSVVAKAFEQIKNSGEVKLFKSDRPEYSDGGQLRDFIYVKDCVRVIAWLLENPSVNGIYNLGTAKARTFLGLTKAVFSALNLPEKITFIEMPQELRGQYQYFTEASMNRLASSGCPVDFLTLEESVKDYVVNHLNTATPYVTPESMRA